MKYQLTAIALLLLASSCNKSDDSAAKQNTWKLGTKTYTVNRYAKTTNDFQAFDNAGNGVAFSFESFPTKDGSYSVVAYSTALGANDVHVVALGSATGSSYFASGNDHTVAKITLVSPGRLGVQLSNTWVIKSATDSLRLSTNIGEL